MSLVAAPAAFAAVSATSPSGVVAISTPGPVLTGVASTYTVTTTNTTSQTASQIQTGIQLPSGMSLKTLDPNCQRTNNPTLSGGTAFVCGLANVAPGASFSATFSAIAASPTTYVDQVQGNLDFGGIPPTSVVSDSVNLSIPVSPGPTDIQVTGSSNNGSPPVGSQFNYTFQVKNNGPQAAYGVTFDDALPPGMTMVGFSSDIASCATGATANSVHCGMDVLGVGQQANIVITATPNTTGSLTDTPSIGMIGPDTHTANNSVSVTVQPK